MGKTEQIAMTLMDSTIGMDLTVFRTGSWMSGTASAITDKEGRWVSLALRDHEERTVALVTLDRADLLELLENPLPLSYTPTNAPPSATTDTP